MSTDPQTTEERRVFERFSARFPVKFKDAREDFGTKIFLRDASAQGLRIISKERYFLDDRLSLDIELTDGRDPMVLSGRIVWAKLFNLSLWDIGIELTELNFLKMQR